MLSGERIVHRANKLGVDADETFGEGCIQADSAEAIGTSIQFNENARGDLALTVAAARCGGFVGSGRLRWDRDGLIGKDFDLETMDTQAGAEGENGLSNLFTLCGLAIDDGEFLEVRLVRGIEDGERGSAQP